MHKAENRGRIDNPIAMAALSRCVGRWLVLTAVVLIAVPAAGATKDVSPTGFVSVFNNEIKASPQDAWKSVVQLPRWWSGEHTWSGDAGNLSLDATAGGCWCERWGNGQSVQHGVVVLVQPGSVLRVNASLGPLQELAVNAVLTIAIAQKDGKTFLRMTYRVSGNSNSDLVELAPAVDGVLGIQYERLRALIETGKAGP
jgi:uncharacterized protein YndB with AHSA1/START domain